MVLIDTCNTIKFFKKCEFGSNNWIVVGSVIFKLSKGSEKGYNLWHKYSIMDLENYNIVLCNKLWETYEEIHKKKMNLKNCALTDVISLSSSSSED